MSNLIVLGFLIVATALEASGDAIVRIGLGHDALGTRCALFGLGGILLLGYGLSLNLAPIEFERVVGLYIATLFVVWQIIAFVFFRTVPTLPVVAGGLIIVVGGLIVTYWRS